MVMVESEKIQAGKRIKIGDVIIIGTKQPIEELKQYA